MGESWTTFVLKVVFLFFFLMWPVLKVFIEFVTIFASVSCFGFFDHQAYGLLADQIHTSYIGR